MNVKRYSQKGIYSKTDDAIRCVLDGNVDLVMLVLSGSNFPSDQLVKTRTDTSLLLLQVVDSPEFVCYS